MYLAAEGQEIEIADAAGSILSRAMPISRLHDDGSADMTVDLRRSLADHGWFSLALAEDLGGSGLSEVEHALFFREVGRRCGPLDILAQCLAANTVNDAGLRRRIAEGLHGVALIIEDGQGYRILGSIDAEFGILVKADAASLIPLSGVTAGARSFIDLANSLRACTDLPQAVDGFAGNRIWILGQLATSAMLIGIAEAALDLIVDYAKIRETFGRKIGSWQAVRHPCADMAVRLEAARAQLWYAAAATNEGHADADVHRGAAKYLSNLAALSNTDSNIQLHGGIGVTFEHNAHLLLKHALVLSRIFGAKRILLSQLLHARLKD
jgi:alkylation response protein AidB-like acyl-CoA dehydrogenase